MTPSHTISRLDDPRVAGYRNLRERSLRDEGLFITEGALLAERLLQSHFSIESLLVTPQSEAHFAEKMPPGVPLYVAEAALLREVVGFDFHRGVLGLGRRPTFPGAVELVEAGISGTSGQKFIVCPGTETGENLGLILRSARAFGVAGVLLPTGGADPLSRRCLRQSMGSALSLPLARSDDLLGEMRHLRRVRGLRLVAAVAGEGAGVIPLADFSWPQLHRSGGRQ
jgi:tRNA G18 (ribose-2'-O)-methylase SpoU